MSEENTQDPTQDDSPNFRKLREKAEKLETANNALRATNAELVAQVAGFDTSNKLTKLVLDQYLAGEDVELTPDAFKAFASEYQLPTAQTEGGEGDAGDTSEAFDALQAGADELRQATSQANGEPTVDEQIATAEAKGDFETARSLKTQGIRQAILSNR